MSERRRALLALLSVAAVLVAFCVSYKFVTSPQTPALEPEETDENLAYGQMREVMVATTIEARGIEDENVLQAMRSVPRHLFVSENLSYLAYRDRALPIGYGQTISQPYIVALMTELLALQSGDKVLEIGTGSAYQAAVLAEIPGVEVFTIEIVPELADSACRRLAELGYSEVHCQQADGYYGWEEYAPFDAIIVTAAPDHLPPPLVEQLSDGGRIVIPIGPRGGIQTLWRYMKSAESELTAENMGGVLFVPFTGAGSGTGEGYLTP